MGSSVLKNDCLQDVAGTISADYLKKLIVEAQKNKMSTRAGYQLGSDSGISYYFEMDSVAKGCLPQKGEGYASVMDSGGTRRKLWSITYFAALADEAKEFDFAQSEGNELLIVFCDALRAHLVPQFDGREMESYELNDTYGCVNMHEPSDNFRHFSGELMINHYGKGKIVSVKYVGGML